MKIILTVSKIGTSVVKIKLEIDLHKIFNEFSN